MEEKKLRPKYGVYRLDEEGRITSAEHMKATDPEDVDSPFVLMPRKDPAAFSAMLDYTRFCEPDLADEIREWLTKIVEAPPVYGTQGGRNRVNMKLRQIRLFS